MVNVSKRLMPVALMGLLTSSLLYGSAPYLITSAQGGPLSDELGGVISFAQAQVNKSLAFEAAVVHRTSSTGHSFWLNDNEEDKFPRGTNIAVVQFTVTNNSDKDVDLFGLYVKASFEGTDELAATVTPVKEAPHVKMGYPAYLIDQFDINEDAWILPAGESLNFAESFYVQGTKVLNVSVVAPERDDVTDTKTVSSESFSLVC